MKNSRIRQVDVLHQKGAYCSLEAAAMSGASLRQLQYWDERAICKPSLGTIGHDRAYSREDIVKLRHLTQMRSENVHMKIAVTALRKRGWDKLEVISVDHPRVINGMLFVASKGKRRC